MLPHPPSRRPTWRPALAACVSYFVIVFACAFALGALRVSWIAPRLGAILAVSLEAPVLLGISWIASRWCLYRFKIRPTVAWGLAIGAGAFALLMAAEYGFAVVILGRSPAEYLAGFTTAAGLVGLSAQIAFALIPLAQILMTRGRLAGSHAI